MGLSTAEALANALGGTLEVKSHKIEGLHSTEAKFSVFTTSLLQNEFFQSDLERFIYSNQAEQRLFRI